MPRLSQKELGLLAEYQDAGTDRDTGIGRVACYLAFNAYVQSAYLMAQVDQSKPITDQAEDIAFEFATLDESGAYDHISSLTDRGWAMLRDPSMNPAVQKLPALLIEYYDKVDEHFDAPAQN